jgi:RND family efflux transporter MFP subunit
VSAGQVLAHLSSSDQQRDVDLTREELDRAEARLAQFERKKSNLEQATVESVRRIDVGDIERRAAQNEVVSLRRQLQYDEAELERTTIRAPAAGLVTTPEAQLLTGVWLKAGDQFLQVDDTRVVEAEIEIPQNDVALAKPGARVQLRPWSARDEEIVGYVTELAPTALDKTRNSIVRVKASVPNAEMLLRPGMTGYAKIRGLEMTVREAYLRLCVRVLTVELWSWVP